MREERLNLNYSLYVKVQDVVPIHGGNGQTPYTDYNKFKLKIPKKHRITDKNLFQRVFSSILSTTADQIVEQDGGVCLKGIGYWCVARSAHKRIKTCKITGELHYNVKFGMRPSRVLFFPYFRGYSKYSAMRFLLMDHTVCESLKNRVREELENGRKYKVYPSTLKRLKLL